MSKCTQATVQNGFIEEPLPILYESMKTGRERKGKKWHVYLKKPNKQKTKTNQPNNNKTAKLNVV